MDAIILRFYDVSEVFKDDERIMAVALYEYTEANSTICSIYKDLLKCRYNKWIDDLERIQHSITDEWIDYMETMIDGYDKSFIKGDLTMIETICCKSEKDE